MLIYLSTNKINNKKYVGYTTLALEKRIKTHIYKSRSKSQYFYLFKNALRKYGPESFSWEILEYCNSIEECCKKEKYYIKTLNTISPNGYNLTEGGNGGVQSYEVKEKISNSLKEYYKKNGHHNFESLTKENRINRAKKAWDTKKKNGFKARSGYKISTDTCKKMSESKNKKNALPWINVKTKEEQNLSCTEMSRYTGLSVSTFHHIKMGRSTCTKTGWKINLQ
jgi:group I intron endonuclease